MPRVKNEPSRRLSSRERRRSTADESILDEDEVAQLEKELEYIRRQKAQRIRKIREERRRSRNVYADERSESSESDEYDEVFETESDYSQSIPSNTSVRPRTSTRNLAEGLEKAQDRFRFNIRRIEKKYTERAKEAKPERLVEIDMDGNFYFPDTMAPRHQQAFINKIYHEDARFGKGLVSAPHNSLDVFDGDLTSHRKCSELDDSFKQKRRKSGDFEKEYRKFDNEDREYRHRDSHNRTEDVVDRRRYEVESPRSRMSEDEESGEDEEESTDDDDEEEAKNLMLESGSETSEDSETDEDDEPEEKTKQTKHNEIEFLKVVPNVNDKHTPTHVASKRRIAATEPRHLKPCGLVNKDPSKLFPMFRKSKTPEVEVKKENEKEKNTDTKKIPGKNEAETAKITKTPTRQSSNKENDEKKNDGTIIDKKKTLDSLDVETSSKNNKQAGSESADKKLSETDVKSMVTTVNVEKKTNVSTPNSTKKTPNMNHVEKTSNVVEAKKEKINEETKNGKTSIPKVEMTKNEKTTQETAPKSVTRAKSVAKLVEAKVPISQITTKKNESNEKKSMETPKTVSMKKSQEAVKSAPKPSEVKPVPQVTRRSETMKRKSNGTDEEGPSAKKNKTNDDEVVSRTSLEVNNEQKVENVKRRKSKNSTKDETTIYEFWNQKVDMNAVKEYQQHIQKKSLTFLGIPIDCIANMPITSYLDFWTQTPSFVKTEINDTFDADYRRYVSKHAKSTKEFKAGYV